MTSEQPPEQWQNDWQKYRDQLSRVARAKGVSANSASDLVQSTIRRVMCHDSAKHTFAYLYTTLRNTLLDRIRWKKRHPAVQLEEGDLNTPRLIDQSFWQNLADKDDAALMIAKLSAELEGVTAQVFDLYFVQDLTREETAHALGLTVAMVATRIHHIRQKGETIANDMKRADEYAENAPH